MFNRTKKLIVAVLAVLLLVFTQTTPVFAADGESVGANGNFSSNTADTEVNLVTATSASGNLTLTVPTSVTLAVTANGTIVAPTTYKIINGGVIGAHVSGITVALEAGYTFNATPGVNTLNLTLANSNQTLTLASGSQALTSGNWNLSGGAEMPLTFAGSVGNISLNGTQKVFEVSYTVEAGTE